MDRRGISKIAIDGSGHLLVEPAGVAASYALIYRAGNGVQWNLSKRAFVASEPQRWSSPDLLAHIVRTVRDECGEQLVVNDETRWANVSAPLKQQLRVACTSAGGADA